MTARAGAVTRIGTGTRGTNRCDDLDRTFMAMQLARCAAHGGRWWTGGAQ